MSIVNRVLGALLAPLVAVVAAMVITSLVILASGGSPGEFWSIILSAPADRVYVNIVNQTSMIFLSAIAAASGFRMKQVNKEGPKIIGPELPGRKRWSARDIRNRVCENCLILDVRSKESFAAAQITG